MEELASLMLLVSVTFFNLSKEQEMDCSGHDQVDTSGRVSVWYRRYLNLPYWKGK